VVYKDDLNWLKGIGCFVWDTPEILHAKHAYDLRSDVSLNWTHCFYLLLNIFQSIVLTGWSSFIPIQIWPEKCYISFSAEISTSCLPPGSILEPVLLSVFINDLEAGLECILSKFEGSAKLGEAVDSISVKISLAWD